MKTFLLIIIQLLALSSSALCQQCPPSAMRIQSPICDTPKNLRVNNSCTTVNLTWKGNSKQQYIVNATGTDNAGNTIFETKTVDHRCDENGNCAATISVQQGTILNWNVQAICNINGAEIYSPVVQAKQTTIPYCNAIAGNAKAENLNEAIHIYPNPTTGNLTVEYTSKTAGNIHLVIYDMMGKQLLNVPYTAVQGRNVYQLNLIRFSQGSYYIGLNDGTEHNRMKFIIQR